MITRIWQEFLKIMQQELGTQMVETWLKAASLERWDAHDHIVYLLAPNSFVKDWLCSHYTNLFERHLARLFNVPNVKIVITDTATPTPPAPATIAAPVSFKPASPTQLPPPSSTAITPAIHEKNSGHLNSTYRFETFVVGPSNQLAYAAAQAIAENPGRVYNPLFFYGGSGLGKTHLLHAIGNRIKERNKRALVLYQSADRFVNEFIYAIRFDKVHQFQAKYKNIDVLLIDDVQFISNKEQTQEAFFHIFNSLHDSHKQIVFSSDTYPKNINGLAERLRSRLEWGLVTDIQVPSLETKIAILKKKAELNGIQLADDVAYFLSSRIIANIRALEGSLIQIMAVASLTQQSITLELAKKVLLKQPQESSNSIPDFERIVRSVCDHYGINVADLRSNTRAKNLSRMRQVAMFLMKKLTNKSLQEIGFYLGRKDHSTVIHAVDKVQALLKSDPDFSLQVMQLEEKVLR